MCLLTFAVCITVHEFGHAVAAYICGAQISEFVLFSDVPHVVVSGKLTAQQEAINCVGGSGLLILSWFCLAVITRRGRYSLVLEVSSILVAIELFAWLLSAAFYPGGPENYDGREFLVISGIPPFYLMTACLTLAALVLLVYKWKSGAAYIPHPELTPSAARDGQVQSLLHGL